MRSKTTYLLTRLVGMVLVFGAVSSSAATLFPFYVAGGLVKWASVTTSTNVSLQNSSIAIPPESVSASSKDTGYRISAGFSFNERWSVEGSYIVGPTQEVKISEVPIEVFDSPFLLDAESKREVTVLRLNPVYEYMLRDPISVQVKTGIARIQSEVVSTNSARSAVPGGFTLPRQSVTESQDEIRAFAASALKLNFQDGKIAIVASLVQYYEASAGLGQALELDLLWRF